MWSQFFTDAAHSIQNSWRTKFAKGAATPVEVEGGAKTLADEVTASLGQRLRWVAKSLNDVHRGSGGLGGTMALGASYGLERAGKYLESRGLEGLACDLVKKVKKHPLPFVATAAGLGFLAGRLLPTRRR